MTDSDLSYGLISYLPRVSVRSQIIYVTVLIAVTAGLLALPFVYVDVSVQAGGLVRPASERSEVKATTGGLLEAVLVKEGQTVQKGQSLFRLKSEVLSTKLLLLNRQQAEKKANIRDLQKLTTGRMPSLGVLESGLYRQQYQQFRSTLQESQHQQQKLLRDFKTSKHLYSQKVIPRVEFEDAQYAYNASVAKYNSLVQQQLSNWQAELTQHRLELTQLDAEVQQLGQEQELYVLKAPVGGTASQLSGRYVGSYVQPGEILAVVSPNSDLIVETYVTPKDIGFIKPGQPVRMQVDAFNYNEWGMLTGRVLDVANDFILMSGAPVFKVRCQLDKAYLALSNGFRGQLKKGMTVQVRFQVARRSLFQLLHDKADDWFNPTTQAEVVTLNRTDGAIDKP